MTRSYPEQLARHLHSLVEDAEDLVKAAAKLEDREVAKLGAEVNRTLDSVRSRLKQFRHQSGKQLAAVARETRRHVHDRPWTVLAAAACVGLLLGVLLAKDGRD